MLIVITILAVSFVAFSNHCTIISKGETRINYARVNMTGPGSITRTGGPYTYTVNLANFGGQVAQGSQWILQKGGTTVWTYPADETATGTISIDLYGSYFPSTGGFTLYLTTDSLVSPVTIYGSKGITAS